MAGDLDIVLYDVYPRAAIVGVAGTQQGIEMFFETEEPGAFMYVGGGWLVTYGFSGSGSLGEADIDLHHKLPPSGAAMAATRDGAWARPTQRVSPCPNGQVDEFSFEETLPKDDVLAGVEHIVSSGGLAPWITWVEG